MKLVLPYPVSSNRYWSSFAYIPKDQRHLPVGRIKPRANTVPTAEAKAYKEAVAWIAKAAGCRVPTEKPIEILSVTLCPRMNKDGSASGTVLDLLNSWKVVEDALQGVVYVNDRQIKRVRGPIEYGPPTEKGALIVELDEYVPPAGGLFAAAA